MALWTAEVATEAPLLQLAISHGLRAFGQEHLKPVHLEAVQALPRTRRIRNRSCRLWKVANLPGATCARSTHLQEAEESDCVSSSRLNDRKLLSVQIHVHQTIVNSSLPCQA